jgi:hypothetical protein
MAKTLQQILGGKNLTGVIQGVAGGVPTDILPEAFLTPTRTVEGNHCTYRKVTGTRQLARLVHYGAKAHVRELSGVGEVLVKLLHSFESIRHDPAVLMNLTQLDDEGKQKLGADEVARRTREFKQLFGNLRAACIYSIFANGAIYFDGDGNLLPSSSGAAITVDVDVPAGNQGQLDVLGDGAIVSASWANAGTAIHKQVAALKKAARKLTGYPLRHAFHGANILDYLLGNTKLKELINRTPAGQQAAAVNEIPDGFLGLQWHAVDEAFYVDADNTHQDFFGGDTVVFTPEPSPEWWEVIEGTYPIPTDVGAISADGEAALGSVTAAAGMFSYAAVAHNPVAVEQFAGDTFLPIPKVPGAIFIADVTP